MRLWFNTKTKFLVSILFGTLGLFILASEAQAVTFTRKVFLQNETPSSVEFRWVTDTNEALIVKYGLTTTYGSQVTSDTVSGTGGSNNHAKITGLTANTKYYYQVTTSGGTALTPAADANHYFKTPPTVGSTTPFSFAIWGDSGNNSTRQNNVAKQVFNKKPNLAFIAGDIAYGYTTDFNNNNNLYFNQYNDTKAGQNSMSFAPYYVTCGNHESSCPTVMADHSLPGGGSVAAQSTFSFDYGNVHFVALNSNGSYAYNATSPQNSDPQVKWAYNDLKASNQPWKVVFWHHNGWSAGSHSSNSAIEGNLVRMASDAGADLVFWGHSHVYERWNKKTGTGFYPNVQEYTIGNGGQASSSSCTSTSPGPGCAAHSSGEAGFLFAEVNGDSMTIRYITETGTNPDTITLSSGGSVTSVPSPTGSSATATPRPSFTPTPIPSSTPTPTPRVTIAPTPTPISGKAVLSLIPSTQTLNANTNGTLSVNVDPKGNSVSSMQFVINYDPAIIRVNNITPGAFFTDPGVGAPVEIIKTIDNNIGQIYYAVGFPLGSNFSSTAVKTAANITFTTLRSGTSAATFVVSGTIRTKVTTLSGTDVLGTTYNASITVPGGATATVTPRPSNTATPRPTATVTPRPSNTPTPRPSVTPLSTPTPISGKAVLSLIPSTQTLNANTNGTLSVNVDPKGNSVSSMQFVINFDPSIVRVNNITPGPFFTDPGVGTPVEIIKNIDNTAGQIYYAVGFPLGSNFSSTAVKTAATITFTTLNPGTSNFTFVVSGTIRTKVTNLAGTDVLGTTYNATVTVPGGTTPTPSPRPSNTPTPGLSVTPTPVLSATPTPIPGSGAVLSITPQTQTVSGINSNGTFNLFVNPNGEQVSSIEFVVNYNPGIIQVNDVTPGAFFTDPGVGAPVEIAKTIDPAQGVIHYAIAFPLGSGFSSTTQAVAAIVSFTTLSAGTSPVNYITVGTPSTKVSDINAQNVLGTVFSGTITVTTNGETPTPTPKVSNTPTPVISGIPDGFRFRDCVSPTKFAGGRDKDDEHDNRGGNGWINVPFPKQTGTFTATFEMTPSRIANAYVGFSKGKANDFTDLTSIVKFTSNGKIVARNKDHYSASRSIDYKAGKTYTIRMVVNIQKKTYSVWVTPQGGKERQIANNYTFRFEKRKVTNLDNMSIFNRDPNKVVKICNIILNATSKGGKPTISQPTPTSVSNVTSTPGPTQAPNDTPTPIPTETPIPSETPFPTSAEPTISEGPTPTGFFESPTPFIPTTTPVPCKETSGDANGDGKVDTQDFDIWLAHYNQFTTNGPSDGDFNCSGFVDGVDYVIWLYAYKGFTTPTPF